MLLLCVVSRCLSAKKRNSEIRLLDIARIRRLQTTNRHCVLSLQTSAALMRLLTLITSMMCALALGWMGVAASTDSSADSSWPMSSAELLFVETFDHDIFTSGRWQKSSKEKYTRQRIQVQPAKYAPDSFANDHGLHADLPLKHYGVGHVFPTPLLIAEPHPVTPLPVDPDNDYEDDEEVFILQYEAKFERGLLCSGATVRLLRSLPKHHTLKDFDSNSPFSILFGPEGCDGKNLVRLYINYRNPVSKQFQESRLNITINVPQDRHSHLYTLVLLRNSDYQVHVDGSPVLHGESLCATHSLTRSHSRCLLQVLCSQTCCRPSIPPNLSTTLRIPNPTTGMTRNLYRTSLPPSQPIGTTTCPSQSPTLCPSSPTTGETTWNPLCGILMLLSPPTGTCA
jgi:hypothetical protein